MNAGRNQACPCGSGRRFKHCCGSSAADHASASLRSRVHFQPIPVPGQHGWADLHKRLEALEAQRVKQQGRGRPILSTEDQGWRHVVVGDQMWSGKWQTFPDFLMAYLHSEFGAEWATTELEKAEQDRHPLTHWLAALDRLMQQQAGPPGVKSLPAHGAPRAVFGLAYDLYLIRHHAQVESDQVSYARLLARLRHPDQFMGARHETRIAGLLLLAGFQLTWEDEQRRQHGGHGEFTATFPETGRTWWVECRMSQTPNDQRAGTFTHLLTSALQKETDLDRLVCVELNRPDVPVDPLHGGWPGDAVNGLRRLERTRSDLPPAMILFSNIPDHRHLNRPLESPGFLLEWFNREGLRLGQRTDLWGMIGEREAHPEVHALFRSIQEHSDVPATFDGTLHGIDETQRLVIGRRYRLPGGIVGELENATVADSERQAYCSLRLADDRRVVVPFKLSDAEMEAWQRHPETFFGVLKPAFPPATSALDLFDFFVASHLRSTREYLLEQLAGHPDYDDLRDQPQPELLKHYAYRLTMAGVGRDGFPAKPAWLGRLKGVGNPK